jgi:hypothetical protein
MFHSPRETLLDPHPQHQTPATLLRPSLPIFIQSSLPTGLGTIDSSSTVFDHNHKPSLWPSSSSTQRIDSAGSQSFQVLSPISQASSVRVAAPLAPNIELSSPHSSAHPSSDLLVDALWHCSLGCGKRYEKSSGRSIRRHITSCFRSHWPGGDRLSECEVQELISAEQESGRLVTGLRRWKMRQSTRSTLELCETDKWTCPEGCGQEYRVSSSRSIQKHLLTCKGRPSSTQPVEGINDDHSETFVPSFRATLPLVPGTERTHIAERKVDRPVLSRRVPAQFDGLEDDMEFGEENDEATGVLRYENSNNDFSPHPLSTSEWHDSPLRILLRRHQLEAEHLSARHFMELVALREETDRVARNSATATRNSATPPQGRYALPEHEVRRPAG